MFDFLPSEPELNPNLKTAKKRNPRKKSIKIQEPSLFDFFYDEEATQENLKPSFEYEKVLEEMESFSKEKKQEMIAKSFEPTMGYAKYSNKALLPKIDFTKETIH